MFLPAGYSTWVKDIDRHRGGAEHCSSDAILPGHRASVVVQSQWNAPMRSTNHNETPRRVRPIRFTGRCYDARPFTKRILKGKKNLHGNSRPIRGGLLRGWANPRTFGWTNENWIYSNERRKIKWMRKSFSIDTNYYVMAAASATHSLWPITCMLIYMQNLRKKSNIQSKSNIVLPSF